MSALDSTSSVDKKVATEGSAYRPTAAATFESAQVDVAAQLVAGKEISYTPEEAERVRFVPHLCQRALLLTGFVTACVGVKLTGILCH